MKVPLSWLQKYIDIELSPAQLADTLTMIGLEVEGIEIQKPNFQEVVIVDVLSAQTHPDADRLRVAQVSDGTTTFQVVCAAQNCREGLRTALAKVGATLVDHEGNQFKVKKSKLRGVDSYGMLCAAEELGLEEKSEGIIEFTEHLALGTDVAQLYGDTVIDVTLTPNLAHCASIYGVARELSAALNLSARKPEVALEENKSTAVDKLCQVTVHDPKGCPRYACRVIRGIKVGPSPEWLKGPLEAAGFRSVNNVVDVTNYVLMELGHPLHAFDANKVAGASLNVRLAQKGEEITTLDGKRRPLHEADLLICDAKAPLAVAGVMGGLESEVSDDTTDVILESAYFSPTFIRKTSKRLGIQTDSSRRFERGADPNQAIESLNRAASLVVSVAGGAVAAGVIDIKESPFPKKVVSCRFDRINLILGTHISLSEVEGIWKRLQFDYTWDGENLFQVTIPTYRIDLHAEIDLIEEVIRFYGYANVPREMNRVVTSKQEDAPIYTFENEMRKRLIALGLQEFLTCDLIGPSILQLVGDGMGKKGDEVKVLNPTSQEQSILRTSLFPGLLQVVRHNWDHHNEDIHGFEVGRVHFKDHEAYKEQSVAGIIVLGDSAPKHWSGAPRPFDFFDLKGIIESLLGQLRINGTTFVQSSLPFFHPHRQASLYSADLKMGSFGQTHPRIQRELGITKPIFFAEIDLHHLLRLREMERQMVEIPIYPSSERDWTITLPKDLPVEKVFQAVRGVRSQLLEEFSMSDLFTSEKLGKAHHNLTFHFVYRNRKKTISQEAVDSEHARIIREVESQLITLTKKQ